MSETLSQRFDAAVARHGRAPAFIHKDAVWSFDNLAALVRVAAQQLYAQGIGAGDTVGVAMVPSPVHVVAQLALARLGAVALPLRSADFEALRETLATRFKVSAVLWDRAEPPVPAGIRKIRLGELALADDPGERAPPAPALGGDAPLRIGLTSGTTGAPRGVLQTHAAFLDRVDKTLVDCDAHSRLLPPNLGLTIGSIFAIGVLCRGGALVFAEMGAASQIATVRKYGVTHWLLAPVVAWSIAEELRHATLGLPSLKHLRIVGAALSPALLDKLRQRCTPNVYLPYGLTELGVITLATPETLRVAPDSAGRVQPWARLEVVDENGSLLPPGGTGEIRVAVTPMPAGYHAEPPGTPSKFRDGWFYPGDLGHLRPDGLLVVEGRTDELLNFGGIKVLPGYVESGLAAHPAVREAAAFLVPGPDGLPMLAAAVRLHGAATVAELLAHARQRLGEAAPLRLFVLDEFPRNAADKVLRRELAQRAAQLMQEAPRAASH